MARFKAALGDRYAPVLRLSLREQPEGGGVRQAVDAAWAAGVTIRQHELLVLVHGYNNHQREAEEAYVAFRDRQAPAAGDGCAHPLQSMLGDVFWPGDASWPGWLDKADFFFYPAAIGHAVQSAGKLAEYIAAREDVLVVHFLGHSMGCRVILEAIKALNAVKARKGLSREAAPLIGKVCLMAAAVPTFKVSPGGDLYEALSTPAFLRVLFSPHDLVLSGAFPAGQSMAPGDEGFFPAAVGRLGDVPLHPGRVDRDHVEGADHGDYWGAHVNRPSTIAEECVRGFLGMTPQARDLSERPGVPARPDVPVRRVAGERSIG